MHFKPKELSMQTAKLFLQDFEMLGLLHDDFSLAFQIAQDEDFEDALQIATALRSGSTEFITFDKKLAKNYANLPTLKMTLLE